MIKPEFQSLFDDPQNWVLASNLSGTITHSKSQLLADIQKLRACLKENRQQRWLLTYQNPYLFAVGFLAIISLNKTVVLSANKKASWLTEIEQSFDGILGDELSSMKLKKTRIELGFSQLALLDVSVQEPIKITGTESIVFFTSGSTGKAKEIAKSLSYLIDEVSTLENTFGAQLMNTVNVSSVSHFHIYGLLFNILWPLLSRRLWVTEVIEFQEQLVGVKEGLEDFIFVSSPAFLSRLDQSLKFDQARMIFSSGGPLSFESANKTHNIFGRLPIEVYGSTETGGIGFRRQTQKNCNWTLFERVLLKAGVDATYLKSPHIGIEGEVKLDDNIQILDRNFFALAGRNDRIVKIEEKRISLTEIEDYLVTLPLVHECACIVLQKNRTIIAAVLVLTQSGLDELKAKGRYQFFLSLKQTMRTRFENVTIPRKWRILEELPINQQSKREYAELKQLFEAAS